MIPGGESSAGNGHRSEHADIENAQPQAKRKLFAHEDKDGMMVVYEDDQDEDGNLSYESHHLDEEEPQLLPPDPQDP